MGGSFHKVSMTNCHKAYNFIISQWSWGEKKREEQTTLIYLVMWMHSQSGFESSIGSANLPGPQCLLPLLCFLNCRYALPKAAFSGIKKAFPNWGNLNSFKSTLTWYSPHDTEYGFSTYLPLKTLL